MNELISIIVPVYKAEQYLDACVSSLRAQTYANIEIILVDDGSPDRCGIMCDAYAEQDERIRVIHQPNRGVSAARNAGIALATGAYIGFADADDWLEPDMYARLYTWIKRERVSIVACGWKVHDERTGGSYVDRNYPPMRLYGEEAIYYALKATHFEGALWNKLFLAELLKKEGGPRLDECIHVGEDLLLVCQCICIVNGLYYCSEPLYHYRIHAQSATQNFSEKRCSILPAFELIIDMCVNMNSSRLLELAKARYAACALFLRALALEKGEKELAAYCLREANKYGGCMHAGVFSFKERIKLWLLRYAPVISRHLWQKLKRWIRLTIHGRTTKDWA